MSILSTSPTATRHFDMNIAEALEDVNAAIILQQLDYWIQKEGVGVIIGKIKYVFNTYKDWRDQQFRWLTKRQFRRSMDLLRSLEIVNVIRYKSREWKQTNYYSINYDRLAEFMRSEKPKSTETVEMTFRADREDRNGQIEMTENEISIYSSKEYTQKSTTKQEKQESDRLSNKSSPFAAATSKEALEGKKSHQSNNPHSERLTASAGQKKVKSEATQSNSPEEKSSVKVDCIVNKNWKSLIPVLDGAGIAINKTLKDLLKLYPAEKVENAIAIVKARKRDQYIPNLSGYFVSALKGDWASQDLVDQKGDRNSEEIDKGAVFRHWYDLGKQLGYCSGQEVRDGEQWVCLSGSWESWGSAIKRGYSLEYMKQIMKRNKRQ